MKKKVTNYLKSLIYVLYFYGSIYEFLRVYVKYQHKINYLNFFLIYNGN